MPENALIEIPSVSEVLLDVEAYTNLHTRYLKYIINTELSQYRKAAKAGQLTLNRMEIKQRIVRVIRTFSENRLQNIINGTGIVLHTGFGRAPLDRALMNRLAKRLDGYVNLEFDLETGQRGDRMDSVRDLMSAIVGAESSLMVNNNAAAVLVTLNTLAEGKEVIISRGQQVEIGGSFRMPDIIRKSQCTMNEVGTTNRTHLSDYEKAVGPRTGLLLWVHTSNYVVRGFTNEVSLSELVRLGKRKKIPVVADLGSGALMDMTLKGIPYEVPVQDTIRDGTTVITFSGDKLLGGPQAGWIVGKKRYIRQIHSNPLYRTIRCDKLAIGLMEDTLRTYTGLGVTARNLTLKLLSTTRSVLKRRGLKLLDRISIKQRRALGLQLVETFVEAGSGSLPVEKIESMALRFKPVDRRLSQLAQDFREGSTPVVGYTHSSYFYIDLKAVLTNQIPKLAEAIQTV